MPGGGLVTTLAGFGLVNVGTFLAQTAGPANDFAPYVSGAGSITAVGGIVYIARLLATGRLVARDPFIETEALKKLAEVNADLLKDAHTRESAYLDLLHQRLTDRPERRGRTGD